MHRPWICPDTYRSSKLGVPHPWGCSTRPAGTNVFIKHKHRPTCKTQNPNENPTWSQMAQSNPEIQSGRKKCHHSIQDHGPKSICAMLEFCTKSSGTDILAHGTEISAPGSVNQQLLTYPDPARHADLPGGFNQLRSHQNIETINYHPLFDSAAKVPRLQRVEYLKSSHQTAASRYFTPSASVHQNGSKSPSGCRPAAPRSAPNERGNRPGKRNLWAKEFHFPSFHLCCNKAGCG